MLIIMYNTPHKLSTCFTHVVWSQRMHALGTNGFTEIALKENVTEAM